MLTVFYCKLNFRNEKNVISQLSPFIKSSDISYGDFGILEIQKPSKLFYGTKILVLYLF